MTRELKNIPFLGVGMGFRKEIADQTMRYKSDIDVLEVTSEHHINTKFFENKFLNKAIGAIPLVPHGLNLSIGAAEDLDWEYLSKIKKLCEYIKAPYYSDHFALTEVNNVRIGHLSPLWFTKEALETVVERVDKVQNFLCLPLVLENITSYFVIPKADFEEPEFISEVVRRTGCGLLLDLANIHINSYNRKMDPYAWLERYPLDNALHIHLAGGKIGCRHENWYSDTHSEELDGVNEGIWELLKRTVKLSRPKVIIIERDDNFKEDFEEMVLNDIRRAKSILAKDA